MACGCVWLDVEIVGDGSGKDTFRGRQGGARQAVEPLVFVDQSGAQRPCAPVTVRGALGEAQRG